MSEGERAATHVNVASPFRAASYPWRLHAGDDALRHLPDEVARAGSSRAFVVCGRTVATETGLLQHVQELLGDRYAGAFGEMDKDCSYLAVRAATEAAADAGADLLVAIGGGSVIVGTRVVAIFMAEPGDPFDLMTQYPPGKPAFSPRLTAEKVPIVNVVTTPTGAMNRAGSGLKNPDLDHRMEYFDPKTRPVALFWDSDALLTAPVGLLRSTGTTTFTQVLQSVALPPPNPLVEGDLAHAMTLAARALPRALEVPDDPGPRIELCAAALLVNRAADDHAGVPPARDAIGSAAYALATALHLRFHEVGQGEATAAVLPTCVRLVPEPNGSPARMAAALGAAVADGRPPGDVAADALTAFYGSIGMPTRIRELGIPESSLAELVRDTVKNFNAYPGDRPADQEQRMLTLFEAAW